MNRSLINSHWQQKIYSNNILDIILLIYRMLYYL